MCFDGERGGTSPAPPKTDDAPPTPGEPLPFFDLRLTRSASQVAVRRPCSGRASPVLALLHGGDVPGYDERGPGPEELGAAAAFVRW